MSAVARHGSLAIGFVADGGQVIYNAAPRPAVTWPHQVGVLPRQAGWFQDRGLAEVLARALAQEGAAVLAGMGGVGKTQLAVQHARARWRDGDLDLLVWISARNRSAIISGYAQAAVEVLGGDITKPDDAAHALLAWLEPKSGAPRRRWLIVLDDLGDPSDLRGLWPPASPHGRTLVTTRRRESALAGTGRRVVEVGPFRSEEALGYLTAVLESHRRPEPATRLAALADDLGHLPLALSQVAAHLVDAGIDCGTYRSLLADRTRTLGDLLPDASGLPDGQSTSVAAAWSLSVEYADELPPRGLAAPMLRLAAMLDPHGIPAAVLAGPPVRAYLDPPRTVAVEEATGALRALHRLSLIDHAPQYPYQAVRIHQVIQRTTRNTLTARQHERLAGIAADALTEAWPDIERDAVFGQVLRANADALVRHAEDALYQPAGVHPVLFRAGNSLGEAGQLSGAIGHYRHVVGAAGSRLGADHPDTLAARHHFARWLGQAGDPAAAVGALFKLLAERERVLGPDHLDTLRTRHNLASFRGMAADWAGGASALAVLLDDMLRVLGPDHLDTLGTRHNLASFRGMAGDRAGAASALAVLLDDMLRVLGPDHPNTFRTRQHLARWRGEAGDPAGAADVLAELVVHRERVLGPDHPDTLRTRHNLASFRGRAGDPAGAADSLAELLAHRERVLGPEHPDTFRTRMALDEFLQLAQEDSVSEPAGDLFESDLVLPRRGGPPEEAQARQAAFDRLEAAQARAGSDPDDAAVLLARLAQDTSVPDSPRATYAPVRVQAAESLARMDGRRRDGMALLEGLAEDTTWYGTSRLEAARALARLDPDAGATLLARWVTATVAETGLGNDGRVEAAKELARTEGHRENGAVLLERLMRETTLDPWSRAAAAKALAEMEKYSWDGVAALERQAEEAINRRVEDVLHDDDAP